MNNGVQAVLGSGELFESPTPEPNHCISCKHNCRLLRNEQATMQVNYNSLALHQLATWSMHDSCTHT